MLPTDKKSIINAIVLCVIIAGAIGILFVVAHVAGIIIPAWVMQILGIGLCVVLAILVIRFFASFIQ